jgi:hypothetical protein
MDSIANFGHLREHDGCAAADQQVGGIAHRRVGGHAGKGIAAAALHAHHQLRSRTGFTLAGIQFCQMAFRYLQNIVNH